MSRLSEVISVPLSKLANSRLNARKDTGDITELVDSVKQEGILQPLLVRPKDGKFEIIIGSRRYAAAKKCGLAAVPAIIKEMTDEEAVVTSLTENLQRNNLEPRELGEAIDVLSNKFNYSQAKIAKALGISPQRVSQIDTAYKLLVKFEDQKISVSLNPPKEDRQAGKAIPLEHTVMIGKAFANPEVRDVLKRMSPKEIDKKQVHLAREIAPLTQYDAEKVVDYFKMYPEKPIDEIVEKGLARTSGVAVEAYLSPSIARKLDRVSEQMGMSLEQIIPEAVEKYLSSDSSPVVHSKGSKEREGTVVSEIDTGYVFKCPVCKGKYHIYHSKPTNTHRFEEVRDS
ncbi:MAG: ParB/RepB/Spo0J family partition protein [Nitrososphaera sp.]